MDIVRLSYKQLNQIESLWDELNSLHGQLSTDFKQHFASNTFAKRCANLSTKDEVVVFAAKLDGATVGYCIVSIDCGRGELDSLYVKSNYRGKSLGENLVSSALDWLKKRNCNKIDIQVAQGNEEVLSFYEQFGFKKRFQVLQINNS